MKCQYIASDCDVAVSCVNRCPERNGDAEQRQYATKQVQAVRGREHVKKAAARVGREINAGIRQLPPRDHLSDQKKKSQRASLRATSGGSCP